MAYPRTFDSSGLHVPEYQYVNIASNVKQETVIIPSTSQVSFGAYSTFDFREKSLLLNDLVLQFQVMNLSCGTQVAANNLPRLYPCFNWFTRIEIVQNNQVIDTIYPQANFLLHQCFLADEDRILTNIGAGNYASASQLFQKTRTVGEYWYLPLWTYFKTSHIPFLYPKDDLQIRLYMDQLVNCVFYDSTVTGSTLPSATLTCNLIANITRLGQDVNLYRLQALNRQVEHYKFLELRYSTYAITAGTPNITLVMNAITGNVSFLYCIVRNANFQQQSNQNPASNSVAFNSTIAANDPNQYLPIVNFSILDSTSTNITGGQPVPLSLMQYYLGRKWITSSYYNDTRNLFTSSTSNILPTSNAIMYSFADSPADAVTSGQFTGAFRFTGSEQLQLLFASTPGNIVLDIYAFVESVVEVSPTYVKKLNL